MKVTGNFFLLHTFCLKRRELLILWQMR
uniref:Uncharacterized protein n=1 Tax=Anguilla anguilla TaxID=7936 RepID=A0A0E9SQ53_ANGAN